jgi:hypothetical protein
VAQEEPLLIKNRRVDRKLLGQTSTQRCQTQECHSWCCTGGVWVDLDEKDRILENADSIKPVLPPDRRDVSKWFDGERDCHLDFPSGWGEGTSVVEDPTHPAGETCIFLRPEDRRCAIQSSSLANGENPWRLKPFFCILHPLTTDEGLLTLDDDNEIYIEGGHCQRPNGVETPLYVTFKAELEFALGQDGYQALVEIAEGRMRVEG